MTAEAWLGHVLAAHMHIFDSKYEEFCGGNANKKKEDDPDAWMEKVECKACD